MRNMVSLGCSSLDAGGEEDKKLALHSVWPSTVRNSDYMIIKICRIVVHVPALFFVTCWLWAFFSVYVVVSF
jgi:hypothetical protein